MDINEATAKALSAERSAADLTIKDLARKSGIPERTLIRILKGERNINVIQIAQLSSVFGIYPHEVIESAERFIERAERGPVDLHDASSASASDDADAEARVRRALAKLNKSDHTLASYHDENKYREMGEEQ
ncbi:helix-turn-helix transcriptional regulator [Bifidobacterium sp. 82T24]|uniref:helix-turn-helix domain-containing protein n=1 Tax=Bifidobacterium pluvialisilvae TaxID=2834436 RepID=UPI001C593B16|nr:helix-turn-helix transcriptional regulator [Bifidobacterium pluvialisilvae]MBW3088794.1 helix-turn-helix transcriptional regulator [Bifidobacterium pluvialisilvae]